jgi:hypothetical protein
MHGLLLFKSILTNTCYHLFAACGHNCLLYYIPTAIKELQMVWCASREHSQVATQDHIMRVTQQYMRLVPCLFESREVDMVSVKSRSALSYTMFTHTIYIFKLAC